MEKTGRWKIGAKKMSNLQKSYSIQTLTGNKRVPADLVTIDCISSGRPTCHPIHFGPTCFRPILI